MENANPVVEANPETSQEAIDPVKQKQNIIEMINTIQYLLGNGLFKGSDTHLVGIATQFCIEWRKYLNNQPK